MATGVLPTGTWPPLVATVARPWGTRAPVRPISGEDWLRPVVATVANRGGHSDGRPISGEIGCWASRGHGRQTVGTVRTPDLWREWLQEVVDRDAAKGRIELHRHDTVAPATAEVSEQNIQSRDGAVCLLLLGNRSSYRSWPAASSRLRQPTCRLQGRPPRGMACKVRGSGR